ncbi:MAG TPA: hypothetical protein VN841_12180 [Bryobacteraceae bacterium]|nr:hypothetical protein [Bryobacteraceae bacterium]
MKRRAVLIFLLSALALWGADLTGTWSADVVLDAGSGTATFVFKQDGEKLTGSYSGTLGKSTVTGTVKGDKAEWSFDIDQVGKATYTGTLDGSTKMKGAVVYGVLGKGTFTAEKK